MIKKRWYLVFSYPVSGVNNLFDAHLSLNWKWLDQEKASVYFSRESMLRNTFRQFLAKGFVGLVWHMESEWISYAWMSTPETLGPPHLPRWIKRLPVYWIFYCRTKEQYQGRGLYKASISLLTRWARERDPNAQVYIDTSPDNIPSRKAIESVGFTPAGMINTLTLRLPKVNLVLWGRWDRKAIHPEIPKEAHL